MDFQPVVKLKLLVLHQTVQPFIVASFSETIPGWGSGFYGFFLSVRPVEEGSFLHAQHERGLACPAEGGIIYY